ncbi:MAG: HIT domain-containing protein, partial [Acidimicrobiales bacterium]
TFFEHVLRATRADPVSQLRLDPLKGRWSVISAERSERPFAFQPRRLPVEGDMRPCPFCPSGGQDDLPPTLELGGAAGWEVRVVPNRYPAFEGTSPMAVTNLGPVFTQAPGSGFHEVLLLGPEHDRSWADLDDHRSGLVMQAVAERMNAHSVLPGLRYSQAIVNSGREAGASLEHPHGQLMGIPFVPREITDELAGFARFAGNCLLCTTLDAEESAGNRVVHADDDVLVVCPYWSGTPFEMLVLPRNHGAHLGRASPGDLAAVGRALQRGLAALHAKLGDVAYNIIFHSAPYRAAGDFHWHAHVLPKATTSDGFELGTGVIINVVPPEDAAGSLRDASCVA